MQIYLDHNASTFLAKKVMQFFSKIVKNKNYEILTNNPSSVHLHGRNGKVELENSREGILSILLKERSKEYDLIFTSGGTESNNQIVKSFSHGVLIGATEHQSIQNPAKETTKTKTIKCDTNGIISTQSLSEEIEKWEFENNNKKTLVSISIANNETGVIQDIKSISEFTQSKGHLFHCDYSQGLGKTKLDIASLNLDYITISGHKIGAPVGIGCLLFKKSAPRPKSLITGGDQEYSLRSGTESAFLAKCMYLAVQEFCLDLIDKNISNWIKLQKKMETKILNYGGIVISKNQPRLPNTSAISMQCISNDIQIANFDLNNIMVSKGSACSAGSYSDSKTLTAMNLKKEIIESTIRVSMGTSNNEKEIDFFCQKWKEIMSSCEHSY